MLVKVKIIYKSNKYLFNYFYLDFINEKKSLLVDFDMNKEYNTVRTTSSK